MTAGQSSSSARAAWLRALALTASIGEESSATFPLLLDRLARRFADAPALLSPGTCLSYRELAQASHRYARWGRAQGWSQGDVVALLMPNCPHYMAIWLGLTRIGVTVALLNTHLRGAPLAHSINTVAARAVLVDATLSDATRGTRALVPTTVRWWAHGEGDDTLARADLQAMEAADTAITEAECPAPTLDQRALFIYTSGTTGLPKAANVSHRRVVQWSYWFAGMMDTQPTDRMYDCLPMYHSIGGVVATGAVLVSGGAVVLREHFSARDFWADVIRERCTLFQYIGELCRYLLNSPVTPEETRHQLRLCCGNGLRADVWQPFQERFHIPQILEYYASTEGSFSLYNCEGRPGAIGRIPPFLSHRLRVALIKIDAASATPERGTDGHCVRCAPNEAGEAIGEIARDSGEAASRFEGYADETASKQKIIRDVFALGDVWYRSGDLLRQDEQGYFYFVDRVGDTYRWKGENVSTSEVAAAIGACQGVREAAVYGVPVAGTEGRAGMAALVVDTSFELTRFRRELAGALPEYARPLFVRVLSSLEMTGTFRPRTQELAIQGYDPAVIRDPLYFDNRASQSYVRLDESLLERIQAGMLRL